MGSSQLHSWSGRREEPHSLWGGISRSLISWGEAPWEEGRSGEQSGALQREAPGLPGGHSGELAGTWDLGPPGGCATRHQCHPTTSK